MSMSSTISKLSGQAGDIFCQFKDRVYQYIKNRVRNAADAEDILSCVFLKVYECIDKYDSSKASLSTWIYAITRNTLNDFLRHKYKTNAVEAYGDDLKDYINDDMAAIDRIIMEEQLEKLNRALERLPKRERDIIILRFYYERTSLQISGLMNLSHGNVRYLQHVAIGRLKKVMNL